MNEIVIAAIALVTIEIEAIEPVERMARALQAPALASPSSHGSEAL